MMKVIRADERPAYELTEFYTPKESRLQLGVMSSDVGYWSKPHFHKKQNKEVIIVIDGECIINLYDKKGNEIHNVKLNVGDVIFLDGTEGHNIVSDDKFKVILVKEGPYVSKEEDKELI